MHFSFADYVLDLAENALHSGARNVRIELHEQGDRMRLRVADDGRGMTEAECRRALDPFVSDGKKHPERRVGLGLPFLKQLAESADGSFDIQSSPGAGTTVELSYRADHFDAPPEGDLVETLVQLLSYEVPERPDQELEVLWQVGGSESTFSRSELREVLGELESVGSRAMLRDFVASQRPEDL